MVRRRIVLTDSDMRNLRELCRERCADEQDDSCFEELERQLDDAVTTDAEGIAPDVATMHSRVRVFDTGLGRFFDYTLVYPHEARLRTGRISVLAPIGIALLGCREGEIIACQVPLGVRRLHVIEVVQRAKPSTTGSGTGPIRRLRERGPREAGTGPHASRPPDGGAARGTGPLRQTG